jgi:hypothetical protein
MKLGLALPKWLIEKDNNFLVLFIYAMAFGIGMPLMVVWFLTRALIFFECDFSLTPNTHPLSRPGGGMRRLKSIQTRF